MSGGREVQKTSGGVEGRMAGSCHWLGSNSTLTRTIDWSTHFTSSSRGFPDKLMLSRLGQVVSSSGSTADIELWLASTFESAGRCRINPGRAVSWLWEIFRTSSLRRYWNSLGRWVNWLWDKSSPTCTHRERERERERERQYLYK